MRVEYRLGKTEDIDAICCMVRDAIAEMESHQIFQWDGIYPTCDDFLEDIHRRELWVGEAEGDLCVVYTINEICDPEYQNGGWRYTDCAYRIVHRLCVNTKYQNQGVARATLIHIEEELRKKNVGAVRLDVHSKNPFALALYTHCGYTQTGTVDWRKGRFYLMEKKL